MQFLECWILQGNVMCDNRKYTHEGFSLSALWCPISTYHLRFLLPWMWDISLQLLQQSTATAPYLGHGVTPLHPRSWPWTWSIYSRPLAAPASCSLVYILVLLIANCLLLIFHGTQVAMISRYSFLFTSHQYIISEESIKLIKEEKYIGS